MRRYSIKIFKNWKKYCVWICVIELDIYVFDFNIFFVTVIFLYYGFGSYNFIYFKQVYTNDQNYVGFKHDKIWFQTVNQNKHF